MSTDVASPVQITTWGVFWMQLPVLVLVVAVIIVAITALRRARTEDVPRIFESFVSVLSRRLDGPPSRRAPLQTSVTATREDIP